MICTKPIYTIIINIYLLVEKEPCPGYWQKSLTQRRARKEEEQKKIPCCIPRYIPPNPSIHFSRKEAAESNNKITTTKTYTHKQAKLPSLIPNNTPATHPPTTPWSTRLRTHIFSLPSQTADHEPRFRNNAWRDVFTSQVSTTPLTAALVGNDNSLFTLPLGEKSVQWDVWLSEDRLWERVCTLGHFRGLDSGALETSHTIFKDIMSAPDAGVERDEQGRIKVHGFTIVVWTEKIPEVAAVA
ncbi:unnamed protein product [Periconia digitata]|uniref:Uncharacterized protein n=1 Tax=Periconia digitata TaxID=1303443 RepID=A0A9W4XWV2_9PLEO|nr:unnamed protein product [Periconia digitata]